MKKANKSILLAMLLLSGPLVSAQSQIKYTIVGAGAISCAKYVSSAGLEQGLTVTWTQGFLSGANTQRLKSEKRVNFLPEYDFIKAYMDRYCRANPLAMYVDGAKKLSEEVLR